LSDARAVAVARLAVEPASAGLFTDYDGSIAEIVADPALAAALPGAVRALHALAGILGIVAVISGRPAGFLAEHLEIAEGRSGLRAYGLYGLESVQVDGTVLAVPAAGPQRVALLEAIVAARRAAPEALIEDKGAIVSLHWRARPGDEPALRAVAERAAADGLVVKEGRQLLELALASGPDKGTVVRGLANGLRAVCSIGDDVGDLSAFDALDDLESGGVVATRIAVMSHEAPADLLSRADLVLRDPADVAAFLAEIAEAVGAG